MISLITDNGLGRLYLRTVHIIHTVYDSCLIFEGFDVSIFPNQPFTNHLKSFEMENDFS